MKDMRKLLLAISFVLALSVEAKVLRVNNYDNSAPYSKVEDAINAAAEGDTIMLDGSPYTYGSIKLDKRLVLIGNGYDLISNAISTEAQETYTYYIEVNAEGCVLKSLNITADVYGGAINVNAPKVIINRCMIASRSTDGSSIKFGEGANNCIIHQNRIRGSIGSSSRTSGHQITNNLLNNINLRVVDNSYVAYNTSWDRWGDTVYNSYQNKIEHNIVNNENFGQGDTNNTYTSNAAGDVSKANNIYELKEQSAELTASGYGVFAGSDSFVISGVPSGPMIEKLDIPTSAEAGGKMKVSVKIGEAK